MLVVDLLLVFIFFTIIKSILVGLLLALGGWILCSFLSVRLFSGFRLEAKHHLLGLLIAVITLILYISLSVTATAKSKIDNAKAYINNITSLTDPLNIDDYLTDEMPELKGLLEGVDIPENMQSQLADILAMKGNINEKKELIQSFLADSYVGSVERSVRKTWWTLFILLVLFQATYWSAMFYMANKKSKRMNSSSTFTNGDYIL